MHNMAPSLLAAEKDYVQAVTDLNTACALLMHRVCPDNSGYVLSGPPPIWPKPKVLCDPALNPPKTESSNLPCIWIGFCHTSQHSDKIISSSFVGDEQSGWVRKNEIKGTGPKKIPHEISTAKGEIYCDIFQGVEHIL